jgi:hypothetical protein
VQLRGPTPPYPPTKNMTTPIILSCPQEKRKKTRKNKNRLATTDPSPKSTCTLRPPSYHPPPSTHTLLPKNLHSYKSTNVKTGPGNAT